MAQPLFLGGVVKYFEKSDEDKDYRMAALNAFGVVGCSALFVTNNHLNLTYIVKIGMRMRVACIALMYNKVSASTKLGHL